MPIPNVGVLRVGMAIAPSTGQQPAATPILGQDPPVRIEEYKTAAGANLLASWKATAGTITVQSVKNIGQRGQFGVMSGTVDAWLAKTGGGIGMHLTGSWACVVSPPYP